MNFLKSYKVNYFEADSKLVEYYYINFFNG